MFLLILLTDCTLFHCLQTFTFHYVSINTLFPLFKSSVYLSLHSTMFLLILTFRQVIAWTAQLFTFHYVSINTPFSFFNSCTATSFTFHYVSINTSGEDQRRAGTEGLYIPLCFY